jgi:hypothetical protein
VVHFEVAAGDVPAEAGMPLEKDGIPLEVIDLRSWLPYDEESVPAGRRMPREDAQAALMLSRN